MTWGGNRLKQLNFAERAFDTPSFGKITIFIARFKRNSNIDDFVKF